MNNSMADAQSSVEGETATSMCLVVSSNHANTTPLSQNDDNCMRTLVSLLDHAVSQNNQTGPDQNTTLRGHVRYVVLMSIPP